MTKLKRAGQSLAEFALCLAIAAMAITGMSLYVRRGFQAKCKQGVDHALSILGPEAAGMQYEPYYASSEMTEKKESKLTTGFPVSSIDVATQSSGWQAQTAPLSAD